RERRSRCSARRARTTTARSPRSTSKTAASSAVRVDGKRLFGQLIERFVARLGELGVRRELSEIITDAGDASDDAANRASREWMPIRHMHPIHEAPERARRRPGLRGEELHALERFAHARTARIDAAHRLEEHVAKERLSPV